MSQNQDPNLVAIWIKLDKKRVVAGALAGLLAGAVAMIFSMILAKACSGDLWFPAKIAALPFVGPTALNYEGGAVTIGLVTHELLALVLGVVFAHFTFTNCVSSLVAMGLAWGSFTWIFINNLFSPSFRDVYAAGISQGSQFFVCLVFGVSLAAVSFFDRAFKGNQR